MVVMREWYWLHGAVAADGAVLDTLQIIREHSALLTELRSRPTREERKSLSKSLRHAQKHIAFLEAKLAASEATLAMTPTREEYRQRWVESEAERERLKVGIKEALEYRMGSVANAILRDALAPAADPEKCSFCEGPATDADGCCEALCPYAASSLNRKDLNE